MGPCFDALRKHVQSFVRGLESGGQFVWDLRLDFLAYHAGESRSGGVFGFRSLYQRDMSLIDGLYRQKGLQTASGKFFNSNLGEFCKGLETVDVSGDEATLIALDTALDFPWREAVGCHRIVVVMTDEALETGVMVRQQVAQIDAMIEKLHTLRAKLFIVGPASDAFDAISAADRSEYQTLDNAHDGLKTANFQQILESIGKSVSVSATLQTPSAKSGVRRGLFGQEKWGSSNEYIMGD